MRRDDRQDIEWWYAIESHDGQKPLGYIFRNTRTGMWGVQYLDYPARKGRSLLLARDIALSMMHEDDRIVPMEDGE